MPRRWSRTSLFLVAFALVVGGVLMLTRTPSLPRVTLPGGSTLEVVKIDVGTNSFCSTERGWKRALRQICPTAWGVRILGAEPGASRRSAHPSMMVWLRRDDDQSAPNRSLTQGGNSPLSGGYTIELLEVGDLQPGDGRGASPRSSIVPGLSCLELRWYPRDKPFVSLVIRARNSDVAIRVPNPTVVSPANWTAHALPQTNHIGPTTVVLDENAVHASNWPRLRLRSSSGHAPGWSEWRTTVFDPLGNWATSGQAWSAGRILDPVVSSGSLRVLAEGREYISAGFISKPGPGESVVLNPPARAEELGVRFLMVAGPGVYRVEDGKVTVEPNADDGSSRDQSVFRGSVLSTRGWQVDLSVTDPGILLVVADSPRREVALRPRIRERDARNGGRIFSEDRFASLVGDDWSFQFRGYRSLHTTNRLEVEVVAECPVTKFLVNRSPKPPEARPSK